MKNRWILLLAAAGLLSLTACGNAPQSSQKTQITVFAAASLDGSLQEIVAAYQTAHPDVEILVNADSSGTLMTQIEEGHPCDIFFSAAQKQMDTLESESFVLDGTRKNVLDNTLVLVTYKDSGTAVTSLKNIGDAKSIALAAQSVPAGNYTRKAMQSLGMIGDETETAEISKALGGVEISEQSNVSKTLTAVAEHSCEVGTVYYSDTYGYESDVEIIEHVDKSLTGEIIYPIARIKNDTADAAQSAAADAFADYLTAQEAGTVFETHLFHLCGKASG